MKLRSLFCLLLTITVVIALVSCNIIGGGKNKKYTVEFKSDGVIVDTQTVAKGETVTAPTAPTKEGYTFDGWYNGDAKWDFSAPVEMNITLVARWTEATPPCTHADKNDDGKCDSCGQDFEDGIDVPSYSITYMDGETKLDLTPATYSANTTDLKLPTPEAKAHYEFAGWFKDAALTEKVEGIDFAANKDLTYYASFVPKTYTIRYSLNGGTNAEANPTTVDITQLPITLQAPTKNNCDFDGWFSDYDCTKLITEINADNVGNITIYAKWTASAKTYYITYLDKDGNELWKDTYFKSNEDQPIRDNPPAIDGFRFVGWFDSVDTSKHYTCIPAGTAEDLVLKARMEDETKFYHEVTYVVDGKYHGMNRFDEETGLPEFPTPSKGGYTFDGWYVNSNCTGEKVTSIPAGTTTNKEFYGKFIPNEYTITYKDGITGNELALTPGTYKTSTEAIALPAIAEVTGYVIDGWYITVDDVIIEKITEIAAGYYGDIVLTAVYTPEVYTITYHLYGGENHENNVESYTYGAVPTLDDPSRDGYLFAGWYTNPAYSGVAVEDLTAYANQSVTLYAKWIPINEGNGGGSTITPEVPF